MGTYRTVDHNNSYLLASNGNNYCLPRVSDSGAVQQVEVFISDTSIGLFAGTNANFTGGYLTIRYTCTNR